MAAQYFLTMTVLTVLGYERVFGDFREVWVKIGRIVQEVDVAFEATEAGAVWMLLLRSFYADWWVRRPRVCLTLLTPSQPDGS